MKINVYLLIMFSLCLLIIMIEKKVNFFLN